MKRLIVILLLSAATLGAAFMFVRSRSRPPKEGVFIQNFHAHRAAYEHLRDMLQTDQQLTSVGKHGVVTTDGAVSAIPPEGTFPVDRYREYLALLDQVGGYAAIRASGNFRIALWAYGFAGNTRHAGIAWLDQEPPLADQIATLDGYRGNPPGQKFAYRNIEGNWYLWTDQ